MNVQEYADFVLSNIGRATLANALNIADKIGDGKSYKAVDFVNSLLVSVDNRVSCGKLDKKVSYSVIGAIAECMKDLESPKNYNERMIMDNLIIGLWEAYCGS